MIDIKAHINNVALHHTIFDLPFAFMGAVLAAGGRPSFHDLFWIALAITTGRAAALAMDNLADLKYDSQQPRMSYRAMVQGRISKREAKVFIGICLLLMVLSVLHLHPICIYLLPLAALPFMIYPFTKRFTGWCHLFLGVAIGMAPAGGWVGVSGQITMPMVLLCIAVALWIGAFDAMYGAQDEEFDKSQGLHSLATEYGANNAFRLSAAMHVVCIACFFAVGVMLTLGQLYFIGVGIAAGTLIYQHRIVSPTDFSRVTQGYFMRNGIVSVAIFACAWLSYIF
ncbi:putative 4-hydroxybenzoate polyprenyltransferase related family protein [Selenomonas ruminantium subsp. lactilytica TAM6421]|uniref:4-hydroxybenzoate polyprenyltransferase n=1 Tax=Selenomonas ruminantium subsp. lactilytica (strain NBRC 103574 / TAM6421) TaxID=927704 RepID=I0GQ23_SELRL|nr:4-hydroxybenzoate octaprenyltransferase [Selenomonas ruminantium]BAL82860.1 putative 4-hydroxybenzoate polyprenyltransferase related family protein [Selenomonas ruminantium subsp. lactilytica TAM6421]